MGFDPEAYWRQTPRVNHSAITGAESRLKREWQTGLHHARWAGFFSQIKLSEHQKFMKRLLDDKPVMTKMSGAAIGATMRALAARSR